MDCVGQLDKLLQFKLFTPKEEVDAIKKNQKILEDKGNKLKEQYDTKKDAYDKYVEECNNSKQMREANIKALKDQILSIKDMNEQK